MTYEELISMKSQRSDKLKEAEELRKKGDYEAHGKMLDEIEKNFNAAIDAGERQLAAEGRFEDNDEKLKGLHDLQKQKAADDAKGRTVDEIRSSNEYAKAFSKALLNSISVKNIWRAGEEYKPLTKALAETGGSPEGSDGGFLVPTEFDNMIVDEAKDYLDLSAFFNEEPVRSLSGWRAVETGTPKKLPQIGENATINEDDKPKFAQISYSVKKYGDRLRISHELMEDNTANLLRYLASWWAPKYILTKNDLLLALLAGVEKVDLTAGSEAKILKTSMITKLNTAHARAARLITNQNGYADMNTWADKNGRDLLVPNPKDPTALMFNGRPVDYADNDEIPDVSTKHPIYVGDFRRVGTLFVRKGIEIAATDVGGQSWETDSHEIRALCRMDAKEVNKKAAFLAQVTAGGMG